MAGRSQLSRTKISLSAKKGDGIINWFSMEQSRSVAVAAGQTTDGCVTAVASTRAQALLPRPQLPLHAATSHLLDTSSPSGTFLRAVQGQGHLRQDL